MFSEDKYDIILVENNLDNARVVIDALNICECDDFNFMHVLSLSQACTAFSKKDFDILLINLDLPESKGIETFHYIKENFPAIPIIVLSESRNEILSSTLLSSGAQDFFVISRINFAEFPKCIGKCIDRYKFLNKTRKSREEQSKAKVMKMANQITATIAHEFNTPLAVIRGSIDLINMFNDVDEEIQEHFSRINRQVEKMTDLLEQLLNLQELKEMDYANGLKIYDIKAKLSVEKDRLKQLSSDLSQR